MPIYNVDTLLEKIEALEAQIAAKDAGEYAFAPDGVRFPAGVPDTREELRAQHDLALQVHNKMAAEIERLRAELRTWHDTHEIVVEARNDALEEAAQVVVDEDGEFSWAGEDRNVRLLQEHSRELAAAIRALKEKRP